MSVVLVCLPGAPKISEEAVKKEEELDKYLETRVEGQHMQHVYTHTFTHANTIDCIYHDIHEDTVTVI